MEVNVKMNYSEIAFPCVFAIMLNNNYVQQDLMFHHKKRMTDPRTNARIKVWGTPTLVKVNNLYANATSFLILTTLFLITWIIKTNDDYELLHPLMSKVDSIWGKNLNNEVKPFRISKINVLKSCW
jgi:hypothetical protein